MHNFCTLFDSYYVTKGLALYKSLKNATNDFHLYVMAFDKDCYDLLTRLSLPHMTVEFVDDFETQELLSVKANRTKAEYCWTCGSSIIYHFIKKYDLPDCAYLDADLMFFSSPQIIYDEIGESSIALTEHFDKAHDVHGRFCVQFVYFKNDENGMNALIWWKNKCIEWCYARYENGKFGDQMYLDGFPVMFRNVHIIQNRGVGIAPWNMNQYSYNLATNVIKYKDAEFSIVFFHFHGVSLDTSNATLCLNIHTFDVFRNDIEQLFIQYIRLLSAVYKEYLGANIARHVINKRSVYQHYIAEIKSIFRNSKLIRYIYYNLLNTKFSGRDKRQI
jgi:hypothetical protein